LKDDSSLLFYHRYKKKEKKKEEAFNTTLGKQKEKRKDKKSGVFLHPSSRRKGRGKKRGGKEYWQNRKGVKKRGNRKVTFSGFTSYLFLTAAVYSEWIRGKRKEEKKGGEQILKENSRQERKKGIYIEKKTTYYSSPIYIFLEAWERRGGEKQKKDDLRRWGDMREGEEKKGGSNGVGRSFPSSFLLSSKKAKKEGKAYEGLVRGKEFEWRSSFYYPYLPAFIPGERS